MNKLRILKWGDYPKLSEQAHCSHRSPYKREAGQPVGGEVQWRGGGKGGC